MVMPRRNSSIFGALLQV